MNMPNLRIFYEMALSSFLCTDDVHLVTTQSLLLFSLYYSPHKTMWLGTMTEMTVLAWKWRGGDQLIIYWILPLFFLEAQCSFSFRHFSHSFYSWFLYGIYLYLLFLITIDGFYSSRAIKTGTFFSSIVLNHILYYLYIRNPQKQSHLPMLELLLSFFFFRLLLTIYMKLYISFYKLKKIYY